MRVIKKWQRIGQNLSSFDQACSSKDGSSVKSALRLDKILTPQA
jgi:hypothetical protein